jgi:hypothetical protein
MQFWRIVYNTIRALYYTAIIAILQLNTEKERTHFPLSAVLTSHP